MCDARSLEVLCNALSEGRFDRRLRRNAEGTARKGCPRPVAFNDRTLEGCAWEKRDLSAKSYVYMWADGIHVQARLEDDPQCLLVIIGATPESKKELVGLTDGIRESAQSWRDLLLDLKRRGLTNGPKLAVPDGALGFWQAVEEIWPNTRCQRCWVHKTANVLKQVIMRICA
jgi:transposase-like protein